MIESFYCKHCQTINELSQDEFDEISVLDRFRIEAVGAICSYCGESSTIRFDDGDDMRSGELAGNVE